MLSKLTNRQKIENLRIGANGPQILAAETKVDIYATKLVKDYGYTKAQISKILISSCQGEIDLDNEKHRDVCIETVRDLVELELISSFNAEMADIAEKHNMTPAVTISTFTPVKLMIDGENASFVKQDELNAISIFNKEVKNHG